MPQLGCLSRSCFILTAIVTHFHFVNLRLFCMSASSLFEDLWDIPASKALLIYTRDS